MADTEEESDSVNQYTIETWVLLPIFAAGTAATLGIISVDILPVVNLGETVVEAGGIEWTVGRLASAGALVAVLWNRDVAFRDTHFQDLWMAYVTLGLIIAPPFFPQFEQTLAEGTAGLITWVAQLMGFITTSYRN